MKPLGNKLIVKPIIKGEKKTEADLIIKEENTPLERSVVVHPPTHAGDIQIKAGDLVIHPAGAASKVEDNGEMFAILSYDDCWAVKSI